MKNTLDALMSPLLSISLDNHLAELERLYQVLWRFGKEQGLPHDVINTMNLALEEIVTNVILHGYDGKDKRQILIRCFIQDGAVIAEVEDDGKPFNPLNFPEPDTSQTLEDRPLGGLGIQLVRKVMDSLDYTYQEGKNYIRLRKRIVK